MKNLGEGNISKNFLLYAIPVILSGVLSQAYGLIDSAVIGKILGEEGLAAIGSTSSFITVVNGLLAGFALGIATYTTMLCGAKKYGKMANSIKTNMIILTGLAVLLTTLMLVFYKPVFKLLAIGDDIYEDSFIYYMITTAGTLFLNINWISVYILNGIGMTSYPLKISILSGTGNVVGKIILVKFFHMGVLGAAVTTVFVAAICSVCYFFKFTKEFKNLGVHGQKLDFNKTEIATAWRQGVPCMLQQMIMCLAPFVIQPIINSMGSAQIAAVSICNRIYMLCAAIFQQSSKTLSAFCSQSIGAGKVRVIKKGVRIAFRQSFLFASPVMLFCLLFPKTVVSFFYKNPDSQSALYVVRYIYACMPFVICQVINNMFHNFFRGVMMPGFATVTTASYTIVRIAVTYVLIGRWEMDGVFVGFIASWMFEMFVQMGIYMSGKWKSKAFLELEKKDC